MIQPSQPPQKELREKSRFCQETLSNTNNLVLQLHFILIALASTSPSFTLNFTAWRRLMGIIRSVLRAFVLSNYYDQGYSDAATGNGPSVIPATMDRVFSGRKGSLMEHGERNTFYNLGYLEGQTQRINRIEDE